jgi:DNA-binding GntR family transcriptional regulator
MISDALALPLTRGLSAEIAVRLTAAILSGQLGPGERLREELLAETMGVSRGPIREALVQLERQGLIVIRRNRGAFVARLSREDVDEVYSLRLAIERFAMQRAVQHADEDDLAQMQALVDAMAGYIEGNISEQEAAQHDIDFHDIIYRASRHQRLYKCWANLRPQIHIMLLSRNVANPDFRDQAAIGHQGLVDSLRLRDGELALRLIDEHLLMA